MANSQSHVALHARTLLGRLSNGSACGAFGIAIGSSEQLCEGITDVRELVVEPQDTLSELELGYKAIMRAIKLLQMLPPLTGGRTYSAVISSEQDHCIVSLLLYKRGGLAQIDDLPCKERVLELFGEVARFQHGTVRFAFHEEYHERATTLALEELDAAGATVTSSMERPVYDDDWEALRIVYEYVRLLCVTSEGTF